MLGFRPRRLAVPLAVCIPLLCLVVPAAVAAYAPGTVVSTYTDARFCGDGSVSVVADSGGNLINVCTSTGQRIAPVDGGVAPYTPPTGNPTFPGAPYTPPGYTPPGYTPTLPGGGTYAPSPFNPAAPYSPGVGYLPAFNNGYVPQVNGYAPPAQGANGSITGTVVRQYNDGNSNCPNGDVTQTTAGFYCTANGQPAAATGYAPVYNNGTYPFPNGYAPQYPGYTPGLTYNGYSPATAGYNGTNGTVVREYNDNRTNCPNGDVTQTTAGFYCTANGQPAART